MFDRGCNPLSKLNQAILLTLTAIICLISPVFAGAQTTVSLPSLNFGSVVVNTTSAKLTITLKNTGAASVLMNSIAVTPGTPYAIHPSSTCPGLTQLAAGASCTVGLTMSPVTTGAQPAGTLTISTTAPNSPNTVALAGNGMPPTTLWTTTVSFGGVVVNTSSAVRTVTLKNYQLTPLNIASITVPGGGYALDPSTTCSTITPLAAGGSCTLALTLTPTVLGAVPAGSLIITTDASNSPQSLPLSGSGIVATTLSSTAAAFGNVVVGQTSPIKMIALKNLQLAPLTFVSLTLPAGGYALDPSTTCSTITPLAGGATCFINLTLTPVALGAIPAGSLTITTNAGNSPQLVALSGAGVAPTTLSAASLAFGSIVVGQASLIKTITLKNNQLTALTFTSITPPGGGYAVDPSTTCSTITPLAAGGSCLIGVTLTPTVVGVVPAGSLVIATNASNSPQSVTLSGTGLAPTTLSATTLAFGTVVVNSTSTIKMLSIKNNQVTNPLTFSSFALSGGSEFALDPSSTCSIAVPLAAGASCNLALTFTPTAIGVRPSGILSINDDASNTGQTVTMTGTGAAPTTLSPTSVAFGAQVVNTTSVTKTIILKNNQASALTITSAIFGGSFALDSGAVTTCPQAGGTVSGTLAAGASCVIGITFDPVAVGATAGGQITIINSAANSPQFTALSGTGVAPTTLLPATANFGSVVQNTASAAKNFVLTNNQTVALNLSSIAVAAPYPVVPATTTCVVGTPVPPKSTCTISLTFTPTSLGVAPASALTITDDAANSPQTAALTGTGIAPVTIWPTSIAFGMVVVNQPVIRNVTLKNNQTKALTISAIGGFSGGYSLDSTGTTCPLAPAGLAPGANCVISVSLSALAVGPQPGSVTVTDDAANSPQAIALSGTAYNPVLVTPSTVAFAAQYVGATSPASLVTVTNVQATPLAIAGVTIGGTNASDFLVTSMCPAVPSTLAAHANCTLSVTFTPSASGTRTATLSVADDALGSPQTIKLQGAGNAPVTVAPTLINNFTAPVGTTSAYKTITIKNNNTSSTVNISSFQLSGDYKQTSTTCGAALPYALAAGASCNLTVSFAPIIGGTRSGQLQVYDDAVTSPQVVNLSGTGTSPLTLSLYSLIYSAQKLGTLSPPKNIVLTNHESQPETFTLTPTGNFTATSNCIGGVIAANSNCIVSIVFAPSATATPGPLTGSLSIAHTAAIGSPLTVALSGSATSTNPPAAVAVVSPGAGAAGTTVNATITGNGWTHFSPSSVITFIDANSGTIPNAITATVPNTATTTANTINAQLVIDPAAIAGARHIVVKTPLSGGGTETATLNSAFIIADASNSHSIDSITPNFGTQGQTLNVNIAATGTSFVQGTTFANFGDGITVNLLTITSPTTAQADITISNTTPIGYRTLTMVTGGEFATSSSTAFQIGPNNATLLSVNPPSSGQGVSLPVYLTASGTHFLQDATKVSITGGVIVGSVAVTSPTTATAQVAVPASASVGVQSVTVSTGGEIATLPNSFTVVSTTPYLTSITPSTGKQGQTLDVDIQGVNTSFSASAILADFTGLITVNSINVISPTDVKVNITISSNANVGSITARLTSGPAGSATIFPFTFTIAPSGASIISVSPPSAPQGGQVSLAVVGLNTHWVQGTTTSAFYPFPIGNIAVNEIIVADSTHATLNISVSTNTPPGTYGFYMATGGEVVSASILVYPQTPTLTMSPANGLPGTSFSVSFTGQFTHFSAANTLPVIAGQGVTLSGFTVTSPVSATATITIAPTAATTARLVTFTTGGEIVTTYFNVTYTPVAIISVQPYHAAQNLTLDVAIYGLNTHWTPGTTAVLFGPQITVNSLTVIDATHLTANISTSYLNSGVPTPSQPGWQTVFVNTGAEQVLGGFAVDPPASPTLVSVNPSSAAQGSQTNVVTITGSLTHWVQGQTVAILGAGVTVANLTILSPTTATATIAVSPTAPVGGNSVSMTTGSEIVSGTGFSVTPSAAYISVVGPPVTCDANFTVAVIPGCSGSGSGTPWVVQQLQTTKLNIVGVGTHWLQGETIVSFGPGVVIDQLAVTSQTTASVQITVLSTSPIGFVPLTTYTDGEAVTLQQAIDIESGFPVMLATAPGAGEQGASMTLQVLGRFTHWQQGVTSLAFNNDITVNSVTVIDPTNLTANITVSPWAYVDYSVPCGHVLTVTTGTEQVVGSVTAPGEPGIFCVAQGAAQINSVAPLTGIQGSTETVNITGSATNFIAGVTTVDFGDPNFHVGQITVTSPTTITVPVAITTSATTGFKTITVRTYGEVASKQYSFTVDPGVGTLTEANPNQAEQGVQNLDVILTGQYSHFNSSSTATFGTGITVNSVTYNSATQVTANISIDPLSYTGVRTVTVTSPGVACQFLIATNYPCQPGATTGSEIVSLNAFTIIPGPAIITQVSPATGNEGQEVVFTITGANTHWQQNFTQFYIAGGGYDITINSVIIDSPTSATVDMTIAPYANPGTRSVFMVTAGESLSDNGAFVVTGGIPVITYLSPNNGLQGSNSLQVTIHGLYTLWDATTTVNFGPGVTVSSFQVDNSTTINALINIDPAAQPGYRTVFVQTGTQGLTGNFLVTAPAPPPTPYIWYYTPSSGLPGQTFSINFNGSNTHWLAGTTTATFGDGITVNTFQVLSATTATANITITATTAHTNLIVFTTNSENESVGFNIVVSVPTLNFIDPNSAMQGAQKVTVNILGQYTTFDATTTFQFGPGITVDGPPTILGPTIATQSISIDQLAATGGRSVVATTPDAVGTAQVVTGAGFYVTPSLALIAAISPNTAKQGDTITVDVTGQNTHWNPSTTFQFGAGIVVTGVQINSPTDATVSLALPPLAPIGATWATARTAGETATINNGFVIQVGTPLLLSSGPGSVQQQSSVIFTILSQATTWTAANPPVVDFGPGITLTHINVTGPTSLTVEGYVLPTTNVGWRNLTVTTGAQALGLNYAVYVSPGPAVINSVSPATGGQGVQLAAVAINGINTHWQQGVTTLTVPGVLINSFVVNSPTLITANITVNLNVPPGQMTVTTTTAGEVATEVNAFTITQTQAALVYINPPSLPQGQTQNVTITSLNTSFAANTTATFGSGVTVNSVTANTATSLAVNITVQPTAALGYRPVTITTGSQVVSSAYLFQVVSGPAAISALNPATGGQGHSLTVLVTGSQTHFAAGVTSASFGGGISVTGVAVVDALHANINISIPNTTPLGAYNVTLTTGGETATILGGLNVSSGTPKLSLVSPPTGHQGDVNMNVSLTGLFTNWVNGTSVANFGAGVTVNSTTVSNSTNAVANITISQGATLGSRTVTMTTGAEVAGITGGFTVLAGVPGVVSAAPASGQAGATVNVTVTGQFTTFQQGFSSVSFGSGITVNFVTVNSTTQLIANITIAANASVGSRTISVATNSENVNLSNGFNVTPGTPVITVINPNIGSPSASVTVTITGLYTNWVNGATTASFGSGISVGGAAVGVSGPVTVNSATNLTAQLTIPAGTPLGPVDVTITTGGEVETIAGGFTVQAAVIPPPSLLSLSPGANAGGIPTNSIITAVFSQPMNRTTINTSTVLLYLASNPSGWVLVPGAVNVDPTGRVMTFTPNAPLAVNSQFYLQMTAGIKDATAAGNTFPQYTTYLYTTAAANTTAPTVIATNPPAASVVGTNVTVQLQFSADMAQPTQSGMTVSTGGTPIAGGYSWNSNVNCCSGWGPGNILTFTPTAPLLPNTVYSVAYDSALTDTAGNALTPGSFTFTTGPGSDTAQSYTGINFSNNQSNIATNFVPRANYTKPINPININTSTVMLYNSDSGKYIQGTVSVANDGMSSTFTPAIPLLPHTYYRFHQAWGYYDADANYLSGIDAYFTTGAGTDLVPPTVASISPADTSTSVPMNAQIVVHFSSPVDPATVNSAVQVTPSGGSPIIGTTSLGSDLATLAFIPTNNLLGGTQYSVQVSGFRDMVGNAGAVFNSSFTTATSVAPLNLSTGLDASGHLITTGGTPDAHWVVTPSGAVTPQTAYVVAPGQGGWSPNWSSYGYADGPRSSVITLNPNAAQGYPNSTYSTTFNLTGYTLSNLCLVGAVQADAYGTLYLNGTAISGQFYPWQGMASINIALQAAGLNAGDNTLSFRLASGWDGYEGVRVQATIQTCGSTYTGGLSIVSTIPASGTTNVPTDTTIAINFNHPLDPATVNASTLPIMIGWNSGQGISGNYQVNGSQVIFTPTVPLPVNTQIDVGTCNGPYDLAGETYPGCYPIQWSYFTTGSTAIAAAVPFQVIAFSPAANATNVGLRAPVTATFNRSVNPGTINQNAATTDFALFAGDSQSPWCTSYSRSQDNATLSFTCYTLPGSTPMTAMLNSNLKDWQGNALANFSSQFTTSQYDSNTNGTVIATRPGNGAGGIDPNLPLVIYTNLPINPSSATGGLQVAQNNALIPGTVQVLDNGYTLMFTPSTPFTAGALIQWWTLSSMTNVTYNTPINASSGYFYVAANNATFTPTVQVMSPANGSNPVARNTIFDLQFNTPLDPATVNNTNIYIYDSGTGYRVDGTYSMPQPNEVRIVPSGDFSANSYIYLYVTANVHSSTSIPASASTQYVYTGPSDDTTAPVVVSAVPFNGAGNVGINVAPGVVFNKPIDPVSLNSSTFQVLNGATPLAGSYWFSSNDTRVEFVPNTPLPASTSLAMILNGVLDQVGHPITFSSTFQTGAGPDFTAPSVVWTSVASSESIPINSSITIQFSESMDLTTFNTNNIRIYDNLLGYNIAATLTWSSDQSTAYLTPAAPLAAGRQYYFSVNSGTDLAGNQVNGMGLNFYATFSGATSAPTVINFNPIGGMTGLGTNAIIEAQFSAPIDPNSLSGVILTNGGVTVATSPVTWAGNTVVQLVPQVPLAPNTTYVMTVAGVRDPAGNAVAPVTSSFTTGATFDINPATAVNSDPPNYATVGTNVVLKLIFNKPLNPITVSNSTFRMYLNDTGQWMPLVVTPSLDGQTVTMQPQVPLLPNTYYHYQACCGYQDQDGNNGNQADLYFYTSSGAVNSGPTVTVSPLPGATGIPLNTKIFASSSAPIDPTSVTQNSIQLLDAGNNPVAGAVSQVNGQLLLFTPTANLLASTTYTINVSGFKDSNGNTVVTSSTTFTTGSLAGTGGLTLVSTNITNGSTNVSNTQPITLTFSQILIPSTVNSSTLKVMVNWNSNNGLAGNYAVNGNQVTFTPTSPYPAGAQIMVGECNGPTDVLGDVFLNGSCYGSQLIYFTVASATDSTEFKVLSVYPPDGATNVRHDQQVSITFNKSASPGSAGGYNSQLFAGQDLQDYGSVTWSADNRTMYFNTGAFYNGTTYTVALPAGGITDMSGNALATNFISSFVTAVNPATGNGSVVGSSPGVNASGVPTVSLLTLYVNRQVEPSTLPGNVYVTVNGQVYAGTVQAAASGLEVQFTPSTPFPNGATVQWFLTSNVYDVYGDPFYGTSGYFYTAPAPDPLAAPSLVAVSPSCCAQNYNVPTNAQFDLQYSMPLDPTTLGGIYFNSSPSTPATFALVPGSPNVVRITPNSPLTPSVFYGLCNNSSLKGTNGVAATGSCWLTYFSTSTGPDTTPGTMSVGPPDGSVNVGTNAYIRLQFSKPVDRTTVNSTNVQVTVGGVAVPGTWSYSTSSNDVYGANFSPVNPLPPSSAVQVAVNGLLDYAGNSFNSPTIQFTTAALPDYSTPSTTLDFNSGQSGIATNATFTCRYSEPMDPSSITSGGTYLWSYVNSARVPVTYTFSTDLMSVTMTPITPLFASSQFNYYCMNGIDLTGNAQSNASSWFYTGNGPSTAGPVLIAANPPNGFTNVPVNTNNGPWAGSSLGLLFNEPVASSSLGGITLTPAGGSPMPIAVYPEYGNTIVWVQLPWALSPNTTYTYNVTGVTDYSGNPMTPASSTFTTGTSFDYTNPTNASASPVNNTTDVSVNVTPSVTFSEAIDPVLITSSQIYLRNHNTNATIPTTISISPDYKTVTLTPTAPLASTTIYDLVYWPYNWYVYDIAGNYNPNYGVETSFTTGTPTPVNGACGTASGSSFSAPPSTNLCSAGTASALTNPGSWSWTCNGQYGGTNASCSATVAPGPACYAQPSGLVSWWKGNDDATDYMGLNNGTLMNGGSYALGEVGDAFSLNGNNQFVLIGQPVPASLQIQNNFAMSAWVYLTSYPASGTVTTILGSEDGNTHAGIGLYLDGATSMTGVPPGSLDLDIGNGSSWYSTFTTTQVPLNQWVLITVTATANQQPQIYLNGILQSVVSPAGETVWNGTVSYTGSWFAIGQTVSSNWPFAGQIDEVQMYNTYLTAAQVQGLYNAGSTGVCP